MKNPLNSVCCVVKYLVTVSSDCPLLSQTMRQRKGFSDALDEGLYPSLILVPVDECDHEGYWASIMCCAPRYTLDVSIPTHWKGDFVKYIPYLNCPLCQS